MTRPADWTRYPSSLWPHFEAAESPLEETPGVPARPDRLSDSERLDEPPAPACEEEPR